jgi:hypothetical protein
MIFTFCNSKLKNPMIFYSNNGNHTMRDIRTYTYNVILVRDLDEAIDATQGQSVPNSCVQMRAFGADARRMTGAIHPGNPGRSQQEYSAVAIAKLRVWDENDQAGRWCQAEGSRSFSPF